IWPTKPTSAACATGLTSNSEPSSPPRPTAGWPSRLSRTRMSEFTLPSRTIFATSTVSASDTRRPSTNFTSIPSRSMCFVISGPPPWTITGFIPTYLRRTTSLANASRSSSSCMAAPPYLMTIVRPWNWRMYGSASSRVSTEEVTPKPPISPQRSEAMAESRGVLRVDPDVLGGEVAEVDVGARLSAAEGDTDLGLGAVAGEVGGADPVGPELLELLAGPGHAGGLGDPAPVGVAAVEGGLDQRRIGDRAGHPLRLVRALRAGHLHPPDPRGALSVGDDLERQLE